MEVVKSEQRRYIYISPHLDDAVMSCGGLIWEQVHAGIPVDIWTVCAGYAPEGELSDLAKRIHISWKVTTAKQVIILRREEDYAAARILNVSVSHLDVPDAMYRKNRFGRNIYPYNVICAPSPADLDLGVIENMAESISVNGLRPDDTLICQLSIGGHVDHRLVRMATERLSRPVFYYIDIPYYLNFPDTLPEFEKGMTSQYFAISDSALHIWQDAIAAYVSQIRMLFGSDAMMRQCIADYRQCFNGQKLLQTKQV